MPASERRLALYLVGFAASAALATACVVGFNAAMDPYGVAQGEWYRLRPRVHDPLTDETPDGGLSDRVHAVRASTAPVLLLGTSRTVTGFPSDGERVFNAGKQAASLRDLEAIIAAAAARPSPPRLYVVEAPALRPPETNVDRFYSPNWPHAVERFLSPLTTRMSLRLLVHMVRGEGTTGAADFRRRGRRRGPGEAPPPPIHGSMAEQARVGASADFRIAFARLAALCGRSGSTLIVHEPPLHPGATSELRAREAQRVAILSGVVAAQRGGRCRIVFLDLSRDLQDIAADPARWYDPLHFDARVGAAILVRVSAVQRR